MPTLYKKLFLCALFCLTGLPSLASDLLVDTEWVNKQLKDNKLVLIDMADETQYQRFHLVGAINLPFTALVTRQKNISMPIPQDKLIALLGKLGVNSDSHVVIYDDMGGLNAARLYWELEQLGHDKVSLMNGGLVKWILEGKPVTNRTAAALKPTSYMAKKNERRRLAGLQDVAPASRNKETVLLDVRSEDEYKGDPREPRSGHIPGAKWFEWDQAVNFSEGFVQQDEKNLRDKLAQLGVNNNKQPIITYCRSSHRASQTYFTLRRLGFDNVKIYTGSMLEYEQQKDQPLTRGMQP